MIAFPSGARVWLATGHTDMRKGFGSLALLVQEALKRDAHAGDLYVFRGRRGDLIKLMRIDSGSRQKTGIDLADSLQNHRILKVAKSRVAGQRERNGSAMPIHRRPMSRPCATNG